jgi:hypothetical protein
LQRPPSPLSDIESDHDISAQPSPVSIDNLLIIKTPYNIDDPVNKTMPFKTTDPDFIWKWTLEQRQLAENAKVAKDINDLNKKVWASICFSNIKLTLAVLKAK